jgi:hypothetical protein
MDGKYSHFKLLACSHCGFAPEPDDGDCIYPVTRDRTLWNINCYETGGGCNVHILGGSPEECVAKWNKRVEFLPPIEGNVLPAVGSRVLIHLASLDDWVENTVVGYYVLPGLVDPTQYRINIQVMDDQGYLNARSLDSIKSVMRK